MNVLAIETATEYCSVALQTGNDVLSRHEHAPREHASLLLPWVDEILAAAQLSLSQMDAIAYGRGPGSFTSLRLGIGVVQGLAFGADLGVCGVSSLAALAQSYGSLEAGQSLLVATDARMQEVFTGRFTVSASTLVLPEGKELVVPPAEIPLTAAPCIGLGNGFAAYADVISKRLDSSLLDKDSNCWPDARSVLKLAFTSIEQGQLSEPDQALPVYIRNQVAQKPQH